MSTESEKVQFLKNRSETKKGYSAKMNWLLAARVHFCHTCFCFGPVFQELYFVWLELEEVTSLLLFKPLFFFCLFQKNMLFLWFFDSPCARMFGPFNPGLSAGKIRLEPEIYLIKIFPKSVFHRIALSRGSSSS